MPEPYGVTPEGFNRKRLNEILADFDSGVKEVFGQNTNLAPQSPHGQFNGMMSYAHSILWELAENIYQSIDPNSATGARLDELLELFGLPKRTPARYSGLNITINGDAGLVIERGTEFFSTGQSVSVFSESTIILDSNGNGVVHASPLNENPVTITIGSIDTIIGDFPAGTTVINNEETIVGVLVKAEETDEEIRQRLIGRRNGVSTPNTVIRLENLLRGLPDVKESVLYVNSGYATDIKEIPAHSYGLVIEGGDDSAIAQTLWENHPAGIGSYGSTTFKITDEQGVCHPIRFSRPREVIALLDIEVRYVDSRCGCQPHDLTGLKDKLISLLEDNRQDCGGFGIGQPLIRSRLYAAFSSIPGLEITNLSMAKHHYVFSFCGNNPEASWDSGGFCKGRWGRDFDWTVESIAMRWNERPVFLPQGITLKVLDKFDNTVAEDCLDELL